MNRRQHPWKAMILAAGFGTRLRPYTEITPKAMFTISGRPLIDRSIRYLIDAGCAAILINTHHLHDQIEAFVAAKKYPVPINTCYEPQILGTGGAIQNAADFFDDHPFVVINSDIITDIPLAQVYDSHLEHTAPITMVLVDDDRYNTVHVDNDGVILGFGGPSTRTLPHSHQRLTFTGIQILDPGVLALIPKGVFSSSIDTYRQMVSNGQSIRAYVANNHRWRDIGTPDAYRDEAVQYLAKKAFTRAYGTSPKEKIRSNRLAGDGSDRVWYRLTAGGRTMIMVDHGICSETGILEVDAFVDIGRHLMRQQVAVPALVAWDRFSGLVIMADLGDVNLQGVVQNTSDLRRAAAHYEKVIDEWIQIAIRGFEGFDSAWTYQTAVYDHELILTKECRYFVDAFVNGYLNLGVKYTTYAAEFEHLAERIMANSVIGLIHRDCQSRNIMVKDSRYYFIDFQGARPGPVQYDLASLLFDPYVVLSREIQSRLLHYGLTKFTKVKSVDQHRFLSGFQYCALSRCLQILGAFGFLTKVKKKAHFEQYIPSAIQSMTRALGAFGQEEFPALKSLTDCIKNRGKP